MSPERQDNPPPRRPSVLYPDLYSWVIFFSALDVMVTRIVLHFNGREANPVADAVLNRFGFTGMIGMKFAIAILVVCACEFVGEKKPFTARMLGVVAVGANAAPVVLGLLQLVAFRWRLI